ncbi:MAG: DUF1801 domain-containing protein [Acidobacteria bacterium]|nr:DUF1801 domain-containing protein [Acidobacteriota bacterium]MCG3194906.1 hypothetical protein [Thermoanaerobaculia bacterium]
MKKPRTVDDYVAACPANAREILERIREVVRAAAPEAEETISYGVPTFKLEGVLVHIPTARPNPRSRTLIFFIRAKPRRSPSGSHSLLSPDFTSCATTSAARVQKTASNGFIE